MLKSYLKRIYDVASRGDAREESYYSALEDLLKEYVESTRSEMGSNLYILHIYRASPMKKLQ